jgi:SulP family sulfate permease
VQILRVHGFVFFGTASGLLERIRTRVEAGGLRYLAIDLRRVTGVDASAAAAFVKVARVAQAHGFEVIVAGASEAVRGQLGRGGFVELDGVVRFEPDLDRGLQVCEDGLLASDGRAGEKADAALASAAGMPPGLAPHLERVELPSGALLIRQGEEPGDVFVLDSGRLAVELTTPAGTRMRVRTIRPGVVVGEVALYTGEARTADVVADRPSVVLRLPRSAIERIEAEDPALAGALHQWLAATLAERLRESQMAVDALLD